MSAPAPRPRPKLVSRRAGHYTTADGRYSLRAGSGPNHDVWTLYDHAIGLASTHHGKQAALAVLRARLGSRP